MKQWIGTAMAFLACSLPGAAVGSKAGQFSVPPTVSITLNQLDRDFVCPERRSSEAARQADVAAFHRSVATVLPTVTDDQLAHIRGGMMQKHHCA
jgi:hypothetical protein